MFVQQFEHVNDSDGFNVPQLGHGTVLIETSSSGESYAGRR